MYERRILSDYQRVRLWSRYLGRVSVIETFGSSVAISGRAIVVGAVLDNDNGSDSGSAYVFVPEGSDWTRKLKIVASDGKEDDFFGSRSAVALDGKTIVVGASGRNEADKDSGVAYVYEVSGLNSPSPAAWLRLLLN